MQVVWKSLYNASSSQDHGTLYQLKNLIDRRNVKTHPKEDFRACDDFFVLVVQGHVLAAAMKVLEVETLTEMPKDAEFDWMLSDQERKIKLEKICNTIIDKFIKVGYESYEGVASDKETRQESEASDESDKESQMETDDESGDEETDDEQSQQEVDDSVFEYATDLLSLGMLYLEFRDAVKEGDGNRVMRCWKYFLPLFKVSGKKNYSIEALQTIFNYKFVMSDMHALQWLYSRFVNTQGLPGCNIPADEHLEHLNRICKDSIAHLGANKSKECIQRVGKCVGVISKLSENFDNEMGISKLSGKHSVASAKKDLDTVVKELVGKTVLTQTRGRKHSVCCKKSIFKKVSKLDMKDWVKKHTKL